MLALYRSGRQAEALSAYRQAQRELSDGLGLEPGEELRQLEQAILRQDPALDLPRRVTGAPDADAPSRSLLVVPQALDGEEALVRLAEPLAGPAATRADRRGDRRRSRARRRDDGTRRAPAGAMAAGVATRAAAFSSRTPARDVVRLANQEGVDLLLVDVAVQG